MSGGVRVATDDGHARLRDAQFRPNHVNDSLILVTAGKDRDAELLTVLVEDLELAS